MVQAKRTQDDQFNPLRKWETWVDQAVRSAEERGEFDDLPGRGKPLNLPDNPFAGGMDIGFGVLKNAGAAPYWIEVDKEIRGEIAALRELRERTARQIAAMLPPDAMRGENVVEPQRSATVRRRWWPFRQHESSRVNTRSRSSLAAAASERGWARQQYLERAAKLNEKIAQYNASLPRNLWRLERPRRTIEQHARDFDLACPPITGEKTIFAAKDVSHS